MEIPPGDARFSMQRIVWQRAFIAASVAWAIVLPLAPLAVAHSGGGTMASAALGAYAIGSVICHQIGARSFHLWSTPLPVCARCTGIYAGAALAALGTAALPPLAPTGGDARTRLFRVVLLAAILPTAATVVYEWTTGITPANATRALAGAPIGAAVAWIIREVN